MRRDRSSQLVQPRLVQVPGRIVASVDRDGRSDAGRAAREDGRHGAHVIDVRMRGDERLKRKATLIKEVDESLTQLPVLARGVARATIDQPGPLVREDKQNRLPSPTLNILTSMQDCS